MKYSYRCDHCETIFDKIKQMRKSQERELCPNCKQLSDRFYGKVESLYIDYNIGKYDTQLGCVIESSQHRRDILKARGLEGTSKSFDVVSYTEKRHREGQKAKEESFRKRMVDKMQEHRTIKVR